ncbi:MAG: hypothetical protein V4629_12455 [Pseudomonadota bacterium]
MMHGSSLPTFSVATLLMQILGYALLPIVIFILIWMGLKQPHLEGLDGAHHVMDGIFFHDLFLDLPWKDPIGYTYEYYRQYPALGFIFWPPFFPFIEGIGFHLGGVHLQTALWTMAVFGMVFAASILTLLRPLLGFPLAWISTVFIISAPTLLPYWQSVMLEIPVIALMVTWVLSWKHWINKPNANRVALVVFVGLCLIYTKQTGAIVVIAAFFATCIWHRHALFNKATVIGAIIFILGALPLIFWTLSFGYSNIEQSIGDNTESIMAGYQGLERFSREAWTFYPQVAWQMIPIFLKPGIVLALIAIVSSLSFWRNHHIYILWTFVFYILFSYFDNRSERFAVLIWPAIAILSIAGWMWLAEKIVKFVFKNARSKIYFVVPFTLILMTVLLATSVLQLQQAVAAPFKGERGIAPLVMEIQPSASPANVMYLGKFRQLFVYYLRVQDSARRRYLLQGEDILAAYPWPKALKDFHVEYVIREKSSDIAMPTQPLKELELIRESSFELDGRDIPVEIWKYAGKFSEQRAEINLQSKLIKPLRAEK